MTLRTLVVRSLFFHWRAHLGVLLGAALGTAILVGALAVGDSVRFSLRDAALARLGNVHLALHGQSRFFRTELAEEVAAELNTPVAPAILLRGTASAGSGDARAGRVQIIGASDAFWRVGGAPPLLRADEEAVVLNQRLAARLGVRVGEEVVLRAEKPSLLSRDAPLSTVDETSVALRLPVSRIASDAEFGRFSLEVNQLPPFNAFVPLALLQGRIALPGRVNLLLIGGAGTPLGPAPANAALWTRWQLADASLELRQLATGDAELRTDRVFLDPPVGTAATAVPGGRGVLTYFVNELRVGERATPYSTVAALEGSVVPPDMADDEILINEWLAEDLRAKPGDSVRLTYYVVGPLRRMITQSRSFRVRAVLPLSGPAGDPTLMPDFPGVADAENCRDWKPGIPVDLDRIRARDEAYWDRHKGTPKAFVTLQAGQSMWNNRFGNLTAIRYARQGQPAAVVETRLRQALNPASIGLFFLPVRDQALTASSQGLDFGQLFLGFSFFLIVAALLLTALLFGLGVEQRADEVGLLLALGFPPRRVQALLLAEGAALALVAGLIGAGAGLLYTRAVIHGLSTVWSGAVGESSLRFAALPGTVIGGGLAGFVVALAAIWLVARKQARAPARELLASGACLETRLPAPGALRAVPPGAPMALAALLGALALVVSGLVTGRGSAGQFFGAGALLLVAAIAACRVLFARIERQSAGGRLTVGSLGTRNSARRWGRSLAAVTLLACGSFLVVAVGANRHDPQEGADLRPSGTGGFALYGETTLAVYGDLNTQAGREAFGLDAADLAGAEVVPLRLREGDEASCLNLNRAQAPRVLGVEPSALRKRGAFTFASLVDPGSAPDPWAMLERPTDGETIPAVGDVNTVVWSLGKSVGDVVTLTDDGGKPVNLRIVGILANSVLQGGLLISEQSFTTHFPSQSGYQVFLIDAPPARAAGVTQALTRALEDVGLALTPAPERLAEFNTVENTYLSIFAVLGGLGLMLGSVGLGVVVLRNVLERRGELALLRAVGFRARLLQWLVFSEHSLLLALGLAAGVLSALVAVLPALRSPGADVPYASLALTLFAVLVSGFIWTWGATALALRGSPLQALRNE